MQNLVPSYLDFSISSLTREQEKFREQMAKTFGATAIGAMEDQVRRNMEMFDRAVKMFSPFGAEGGEEGQAPSKPGEQPAAASKSDPEIESLKKQLSDVQDRLDKISKKR